MAATATICYSLNKLNTEKRELYFIFSLSATREIVRSLLKLINTISSSAVFPTLPLSLSFSLYAPLRNTLCFTK